MTTETRADEICKNAVEIRRARREQAETAVETQPDARVRGVAEAARAFIWEGENWAAYQDSKTSSSVAWPPEFLLLAEAVEKLYGPPPTDEEE
jgi:hypothetical protein